MVEACTASTSPACTLVISWGARTDWNIVLLAAGLRTLRPLLAAKKLALSRTFHSHSRFCRKAIWDGKASLLRVVSIWNTFTCSPSRRPIRQAEEWSRSEEHTSRLQSLTNL